MSKKEVVKRERTGFVAIIVTSIVFVTILMFLVKSDNIKFTVSHGVSFNEQWTRSDTGESFSFPTRISLKHGESIEFTNTIPDFVHNGSAMYYNCSYMSNTVYVDGEKVWEFANSPTLPFGQLRGSAYAIIPIGEKDKGKEVKIVMTNPYGNLTATLENIECGEAGELKLNLLWVSLWRICYFVFLFSLAIVSLFMGLIRSRVGNGERSLTFLYFSMLSLTVANWILIDPSVVQFFSNNTSITQVMSFVCLILIGSFYMGLCGSLFPKCKKLFNNMRYVGFSLMYLMFVLYVTDICDPTTFAYLIFLYAIGYLVVSFVVIIKYKNSHRLGTHLIVGVFILIAGVLTSIIRYILNPLGNSAVFYFAIAYAIYIVILFFVTIDEEENMIGESVKAMMYKKLAYSDTLTGVWNRSAFEESLRRLGDNQCEPMKVGLFICDLNSLKWVNDNLGHAKGDELICATANCLRNAMPKANIFRIGGDEYAVVVDHVEENEGKMLRLIRDEIDEANRTRENKISLAIGYSECMVPTGENIERILYMEADKHMYANKKIMKS